MQLLCKSTNEAADTCCGVCGQGFTIVWERQTRTERAQALREVAKTLRKHHYRIAGPEAHPRHGFAVTDAGSSADFSEAADFGGVPSWAL